MTLDEPFNLELLFATDEDIRGMREVKVLDIMEGMTKNFHPDGLFSTDIFGKMGGEFRNRLFSFIDLKVPVFHPTLFKTIIRLKSLYEEIMLGKSFAVFNPKTKDFEKSTIMLGETGYNFFFKHFHELQFEDRKAISRKTGIKLIEKYRERSWINKLFILPAGIRDYSVDETGKPSEDEINSLYRTVMKLCFSLDNIAIVKNLEFLDMTRINIQLAIGVIYDHIVEMLKGKKKAVQSHWTTRRIINSTRNVITAHVPSVTTLGGDKSVGCNEIVVGLYQYLRAAIPLNVKEVREKFSSRVFTTQNGPASLINKKTLKPESVIVDSGEHDAWMTYEGLEKIFSRYADVSLRHRPLEINGCYMGLIYKGSNGTFKIIHDVDEVPESLKELGTIEPLTMTEMLYSCVYELSKTVLAFSTRYPVAGYGGIFPCYTYLKSTVKSEVRYELDDMFEKKENPACEFPVVNEPFFDSMSLHASHLAAAGADYDGDKMSYTCVWTDDAKEELEGILNGWPYYVDPSGKMSFSLSDDVIDIVLASMTKKSS